MLLHFKVPFTGSSMNPARSFGPAVITKLWTNHWVSNKTIFDCNPVSQIPSIQILFLVYCKFCEFQVYWIGPCLGGMCAGIVYQMLFKAKEPTSYSSVNLSETKT